MKRDIEFLKQLGGKIKDARYKKGLSVRKLAELCELDYSCLNRSENGQYSMQILTLKKIADTLGLDVKDFL